MKKFPQDILEIYAEWVVLMNPHVSNWGGGLHDTLSHGPGAIWLSDRSNNRVRRPAPDFGDCYYESLLPWLCSDSKSSMHWSHSWLVATRPVRLWSCLQHLFMWRCYSLEFYPWSVIVAWKLALQWFYIQKALVWIQLVVCYNQVVFKVNSYL